MSDVGITKLSKDMQKGFADVNKRFESIDKRFDAVDKRFDAVDQKFESIDKRFDTADKRTDKIDEQLDRLAKLVIEGFDYVDKVLETKANATDIQRIFKILDDLSKRLEITEDERLVMASQLTRLHDWVEQAAKRIDLEFVR